MRFELSRHLEEPSLGKTVVKWLLLSQKILVREYTQLEVPTKILLAEYTS